MKFTDLNREGGIGSNAMLVEIGSFRIVVDSGLHPKLVGTPSLPVISQIGKENVDLIILTHCHLDHLGSLPVLFRNQSQAQILASIPSCVLAPRMLHNSVNVMMRQREAHNCPELPLYTHGEINAIEKSMLSMNYGQTRTFRSGADEIEVTFHPAGHVAGAAGVEIVHKHRKIFFTGDVLFSKQYILQGARFPRGPFDTLIMETTHGMKERPENETRSSEVERLIVEIEHTLSRGGSCLIPVFALGRMQEIFTIIHNARKEGKIRKCPIYTAGLGMAISDIFDEISKKTGLVKFRRKILKSLNVQNLSKNLTPGQAPSTPSIFIVSSGMLIEQTPSYKVTATLLAHHNSSICFVGYCDPDTPGGKLLETQAGESFVFNTLDYSCNVKARINQFNLTGHADREELINYALACDPRVVVLTHGDADARQWFNDKFAHTTPETNVLNPAPLETYTI